VRDARGDPLAMPERPEPAPVWSPEVTSELRELLVAVTAEGTASRAFHDRRGLPLLGPVRVAGKTGTLNGADPPGRYQWFIGVAPADAPRIAVATMVVNDPEGEGSAARVAAASLRAVFCDGDRCDASAVERLHARSEAFAADRSVALREASELDEAPRPVEVAGFEFPRHLLREPVYGQIDLVVMLGPTGEVLDVEVAASDLPEFDELVTAQVRAWKFTPPRHRGRPAYASARLPIPIRIQ
jgi:TonB family protein